MSPISHGFIGEHKPDEPKKYTEREYVLAQRDAFMAGLADPIQYWGKDALQEARKRYPLPRVTRPRVVKDATGWEWMLADGSQLRYRASFASDWSDSLNLGAKGRIAALRDLLANPTETVEEDA